MKQSVFISTGDAFHTVTTPAGEAVHGVCRATVTIEPSKPATASLELISRFSGPAIAEFVVRDPTSGLLKPVDRIHFTDGTTFPPHD